MHPSNKLRNLSRIAPFQRTSPGVIQGFFVELEENECLLADGFEGALIGITYGANPVAVYEVTMCIDLLMSEGMSYEDAWEHFSYNVAGSYVGEETARKRTF